MDVAGFSSSILCSTQKVAVESALVSSDQRLSFSQRAGKNIVLSFDRRKADRKDAGTVASFGGLVTDRPLMEDEMFIIELSGTMYRWGGHSLGFGVTNACAENMDFPPWMALSKSDICMMYYYEGWPGEFCVYRNRMEICKQCGNNKQQPKIGDQFSVVRKRNGDLLFYVNGKIQAKALLNTHGIFHGVVEVRGNANQVTIVDSFSLPTIK